MNRSSTAKARLAALGLLAVSSFGGLAAPASAASACAAGWSDLGNGVCEKILAYNGTATTVGTVQYVTVPANVTSMTMIAAGASGQGSLDNGEGSPAVGGRGGRQTGTIPVVPGDTLSVYVGQSGDTVPQTPTRGWMLADPNNPGAYTITGAFGGGGLSSSNFGGFGGGGSFVFDSQPVPNDPYGSIGNLLIAAGGGGGAGYDENQFVTHGAYGPQQTNGGHGSGAAAATDGIAVGLLPQVGGTGYSPGAGRGAAIDAPGAGGVPAIPSSYWFGQVPGGSGLGPAVLPDAANPAYTWLYLGAGGNAQKGTCCYYYGEAGGGGGGNYGGGAGGSIEAEYEGGGGGGGSGFVAANATNTLAETGVQIGDGEVRLRYTVTATSTPPAVSSLSPVQGSVGTTVTLAGSNFSAATRVAFNGTAASFRIASATQITAVVPAGATTGPVTVTNASGSGSSAASFTVTVVPTTLSALKISAAALAPTFASTTTAYSASVAYTVGSTTITATATSASAGLALSVNGSAFGALVSGAASAAQTLNVGANTLVVRVTAPDATYRDYTVTVTRAAPQSVATLSALKASAHALSPAFAKTTYTYSAAVAYTVSSTTITATVTSGSSATLKYQVGGTAGAWTPLASGTASASVPLAAGSTTSIYVLVTAQDGVTTNTYRVSIARAAPGSVKTLSSLKFSVGTLTPAFSPTTLDYAIAIPAASASYRITATVTSGSGATLAYQVGSAGPWLKLTSGTASALITAVAGTTPVRVRVTAQDGSWQDYLTNVSH